ncbi:MAG: CAP domain-containing protein, partial [Oscillospiraceae bacterium]
LATDDLLMQAAQVRAEEMAATNLYSHTRPNGKSFFTVTDVPYMAENIHCIWDSPDSPMAVDVVALWSRSEGHRKNMLNGRVDSIGIGIAAGIDENGVGCSYCVQLFLYEGNRITWVDTPICSIP